MSTYPTEPRQALSFRDLPLLQLSNLGPSVGAGHFPSCLRPSVPKRMHTLTSTRDEAKVPSAFSKRSANKLRLSMEQPSNKAVILDSIRLAKAEEWFDDINRNAASVRNAAFPDNDPPFYLRPRSSADISSEIDSACAVRSDRSSQLRARSGRPRRTPPTGSMRSRMESSGSTSEDLRSVIDDLTIKNKKLRQKLRVYNRLHCSHLQNEKLFEVRIHGLPSHKKKEFEKTLRGFVSSPEAPSSRPVFLPAPLPTIYKIPSSFTLDSKPVDSTYASLSASGQTMNSHSNRNGTKGSERQAQPAGSRMGNVRSYLHDMPRGLLPRKSPFMSEKTKQKMVVRRLERIFTGRCAASSGHHHSLQQQKVSNSAAKADSREFEAGGRGLDGDGMREARFSTNVEIPMQSPIKSDSYMQPRDKNDGDDFKSRTTIPSNDGTPDQRPTRPLDLDIYRAQVPAENMKYIRHLGLASPPADPNTNCDYVDGWVYLNMLTNLAQIHILNVTPEFIRKSIAHVSSKFELSDDGHKIRWKGGTVGTPMSSDSDESVEPHSDMNDTSDASINNSFAGFEERAKRRPILLDQWNNGTNLHYKPLFYQGSCSENEDDLYVHDDDSLASFKSANTLACAGANFKDQTLGSSFISRGQTKESGPIIYFSKAKFCTDLSGDPTGDLKDHIVYSRYFEEPIGRDQKSRLERARRAAEDDPTEESLESRRAEESMNDATMAESDLRLEKVNASDGEDVYDGVAPIYLEASGLGGVQPQDNFVIEVEVQYSRSDTLIPKAPIAQSFARRVLYNFQKPNIDTPHKAGYLQQKTSYAVEAQIVSTIITALPPSDLPEPSYICLPFSSDNEDDDSIESSEDNVDKKLPHLTLADSDAMKKENESPIDFLLGSSGHTSEKSSYATTSNGSDDSSIDLLAQARVLDPDAIAAREREFEINAESHYRQISSAETAGGATGSDSNPSSSPSSSSSSSSGSPGRSRNRAPPNAKRRRTTASGRNRLLRVSGDI